MTIDEYEAWKATRLAAVDVDAWAREEKLVAAKRLNDGRLAGVREQTFGNFRLIITSDPVFVDDSY